MTKVNTVSDTENSPIFQNVLDEKENERVSVCYHVKITF